MASSSWQADFLVGSARSQLEKEDAGHAGPHCRPGVTDGNRLCTSTLSFPGFGEGWGTSHRKIKCFFLSIIKHVVETCQLECHGIESNSKATCEMFSQLPPLAYLDSTVVTRMINKYGSSTLLCTGCPSCTLRSVCRQQLLSHFLGTPLNICTWSLRDSHFILSYLIILLVGAAE
jgi:hypothetical protein